MLLQQLIFFKQANFLEKMTSCSSLENDVFLKTAACSCEVTLKEIYERCQSIRKVIGSSHKSKDPLREAMGSGDLDRQAINKKLSSAEEVSKTYFHKRRKQIKQ